MRLAVPAAVRRLDGTVAVMVVALVHTELSVMADPGVGVTGVHVTVDPLAKLVPAMVSAKWLMPMLAVAPLARVSIRVMAGAVLTVRFMVEVAPSGFVTRTAGVPAMSDALGIVAVRTVAEV